MIVLWFLEVLLKNKIESFLDIEIHQILLDTPRIIFHFWDQTKVRNNCYINNKFRVCKYLRNLMYIYSKILLSNQYETILIGILNVFIF